MEVFEIFNIEYIGHESRFQLKIPSALSIVTKSQEIYQIVNFSIMASYIVRVELHSASSGDYENLHAVMGRAGYVRWIESEQGIKFHLPTAEYATTSALRPLEIVNNVQKITNSIGKNSWILVIDYNNIAFHLSKI